jgi:ABC-type amino acid transport substrate-binding protein
VKKLTKILAALLAVAMLFTLSACGGSKNAGNNSSGGDANSGGQAASPKLKILDTEYAVEEYAICFTKDNEELLNKVNQALSELKEEGVVGKIVDKYISGVEHDLVFQQDAEGKPELIMGTNAEFPPYEFYEGDKVVGIDAEIAAAIADKLGMKLVIEDMAFDSIIAAVQSGKVDMGMAGMTVTEDRLQSVNFSDTYATGIQVVIVREDSPITSVDDLFAEGANNTVGVQTGTTGDLYATWDIEDAGLGKVERYNKGADAVQALVSGKIDCVIIDNEPAKAFVEAYNK